MTAERMIIGIVEDRVQIFNSIFFTLFNFNIYYLFTSVIGLFIEKLFNFKQVFEIKQWIKVVFLTVLNDS